MVGFGAGGIMRCGGGSPRGVVAQAHKLALNNRHALNDTLLDLDHSFDDPNIGFLRDVGALESVGPIVGGLPQVEERDRGQGRQRAGEREPGHQARDHAGGAGAGSGLAPRFTRLSLA